MCIVPALCEIVIIIFPSCTLAYTALSRNTIFSTASNREISADFMFLVVLATRRTVCLTAAVNLSIKSPRTFVGWCCNRWPSLGSVNTMSYWWIRWQPVIGNIINRALIERLWADYENNCHIAAQRPKARVQKSIRHLCFCARKTQSCLFVELH